MEKRSFKKILLSTVLSAALAIVPATFASAATVSVDWDPANLTVNNNVGIADTVVLTGLKAGAVMKVYKTNPADTSAKPKLLGQATAKDGTATATVGNLTEGDDIFVTVVLETSASSKKVGAPAKTEKAVTDQVYVQNNAGIADTVTVTGLTYAGTKVTVLNGTTPIGTGTSALVSSKSTAVKDVVISIPTKSNLGNGSSGSINIVLQDKGKDPSDPVSVSFSAEEKTSVTGVTYATYNNFGKADQVKVSNIGNTGLVAGDTVILWKESGAKTKIASAVVSKSLVATFNVANLDSTGAAGSVWFTVTRKGYLQSDAQEAKFDAEPVTDKPSVTGVTYVNSKSTSDKVTIANSSIKKGATVTLFDNGAKIASGTVTVEGTITLSASNKLGATGGTKLTITVKEVGKRESIASDEFSYGPES
ncbi:hypothetical protein [Cohnella candidum]|uniref:Uncharacterized protein n=1 Tax=Cohnella candidum TaxID=2674991 RepID=A0A3G3K0Y8_9BACL|nr:hypothetical protein [Cohnella candidum]AYQ74118.1 hypothetical protein EAV92_17040 [Cohnella candidum]